MPIFILIKKIVSSCDINKSNVLQMIASSYYVRKPIKLSSAGHGSSNLSDLDSIIMSAQVNNFIDDHSHCDINSNIGMLLIRTCQQATFCA